MLVQERRNSITNALELRLSCTNLSKRYVAPTGEYMEKDDCETSRLISVILVTLSQDVV